MGPLTVQKGEYTGWLVPLQSGEEGVEYDLPITRLQAKSVDYTVFYDNGPEKWIAGSWLS